MHKDDLKPSKSTAQYRPVQSTKPRQNDRNTRPKMTDDSHVTYDPIPRVEYIWIRNTLTELVEINNNKRVLGPSEWKTITLKHTFPFSGRWFLVRDVFVFLHHQCLWRHECKTSISSQNRWSTNSSKWCTLCMYQMFYEFCIQCNHDILGLCRKLEELYWWHKSHHKRLPSYTTRPSHPKTTYTFLIYVFSLLPPLPLVKYQKKHTN